MKSILGNLIIHMGDNLTDYSGIVTYYSEALNMIADKDPFDYKVYTAVYRDYRSEYTKYSIYYKIYTTLFKIYCKIFSN